MKRNSAQGNLTKTSFFVKFMQFCEKKFTFCDSEVFVSLFLKGFEDIS